MKRQFITSFVTLIVLTFALLPLSWATAATAAFFQEEEAEEALTQEEYEAHVAQTDAYMAAINEEDWYCPTEEIAGNS